MSPFISISLDEKLWQLRQQHSTKLTEESWTCGHTQKGEKDGLNKCFLIKSDHVKIRKRFFFLSQNEPARVKRQKNKRERTSSDYLSPVCSVICLLVDLHSDCVLLAGEQRKVAVKECIEIKQDATSEAATLFGLLLLLSSFYPPCPLPLAFYG